jgi:hypothetical protein
MGKTRRKHSGLLVSPRRSAGRSCLLLTLLLTAQVARAEPTAARELQAKEACLLGDPATGVSILMELYVETSHPTYLFNAGLCFERNGRYEEAILRYREYLRKATDAKEADRAAAEKHIAGCQALMRAQHAAPAPRYPAHPGVPIAVAPPPTQVSTTVAPPRQPADAGSGLRFTGITIAVFGVAALAAGVAFNVQANGIAHDLQSTTTYERSREVTRANYETLGWVSYGIGGACAAGGVLLYYLGYRQGRSASASVTFLPSFAPGQAGVILRGAL